MVIGRPLKTLIGTHVFFFFFPCEITEYSSGWDDFYLIYHVFTDKLALS